MCIIRKTVSFFFVCLRVCVFFFKLLRHFKHEFTTILWDIKIEPIFNWLFRQFGFYICMYTWKIRKTLSTLTKWPIIVFSSIFCRWLNGNCSVYVCNVGHYYVNTVYNLILRSKKMKKKKFNCIDNTLVCFILFTASPAAPLMWCIITSNIHSI